MRRAPGVRTFLSVVVRGLENPRPFAHCPRRPRSPATRPTMGEPCADALETAVLGGMFVVSWNPFTYPFTAKRYAFTQNGYAGVNGSIVGETGARIFLSVVVYGLENPCPFLLSATVILKNHSRLQWAPARGLSPRIRPRFGCGWVRQIRRVGRIKLRFSLAGLLRCGHEAQESVGFCPQMKQSAFSIIGRKSGSSHGEVRKARRSLRRNVFRQN
jgi:hypothetical protein